MHECYHPGIRNEYRTTGDTPEAAEAAMRRLLQDRHGGLAPAMLANCRVARIIPEPDVPHAVAWVEGRDNARTHPPMLGRTRKEAEHRLRATHRVWNGQRVVSAALSRCPARIRDWLQASR